MIFGNAAWGFRELKIEEQLKITNDMGLKIHELGIENAPTDVKIGDSMPAVAELYKKYKIDLVCAATGNDFTTGNNDDVNKIMNIIDMCSEVQIKYLRIFAGFSPVNDVVGGRWSTMVNSLNCLAEYVKNKNVVLVIETHGGVNGFENGEVEHFNSVTTTEETLKRLLDELDENIMFNYDPANLYAIGIKKPDSIYQILKDRVAYVHLKDFKTMPSGHIKPAACGESDMDWKEIMEGLKDFEGPMLFEYENTDDLKDGLNRSYSFIKEINK